MIGKRLLVLNGSHSEIPLVVAAKDLGFYVITTGNNPLLPGHKYGDEYRYGDFSDKELMLGLARDLKIDAICSCANDFGAITAAFVAESMGLPGHDSFHTSLTLHHKDKFKEFSRKIGLNTPKAYSFASEAEAVEQFTEFPAPVIVKPVDLTGGKGVAIARNLAEYRDAVGTAMRLSRQNKIVVEEFFEGVQHSFSTFLYRGRVVQYFSDDEFSYLNPYLVSTSGGPASSFDLFESDLIADAEKIAAELDLVDGVLHFQYLTKGREYTIIEVTRRCSGDLYPLPVKFACSCDWSNYIVRAETGCFYEKIESRPQHGFYGRHCIMSSSNGKMLDVHISESIKENIVDEYYWWTPGLRIRDHLVEKFGVLILQFRTREEMDSKLKVINELVRVVVG